jgi:hypothetical protein
MTEYAIKLMSFGHRQTDRRAPKFGAVKFGQVASFTDLQEHRVRCTSGYLWITVENDRDDHVIHPGQAFLVPDGGKVIVGGKGGYAVEPTPALAKAN